MKKRFSKTYSRKQLLTVGALALVVLGGAYYGFRNGTNGVQDINPAAGAPQGMPVEAVAVTMQPLERGIEAIGTLQSNESVIVRPEIAGLVTEISFEEGSEVSQNKVLVRLDGSIYQAEVAQAEANAQLSQTNFNRAQELYAKKTGSERARDEARAQMNVDKARLDLARAQFAKTEIRAPFDGVTGLRAVSVGDYVTAGQVLVNIEDIDPVKVDFRVGEIFLPDVSVGQVIHVRIDALPDRVFEGEVYAIDPRIDEGGRSIVIRARIDNHDKLLRPGLFARVNLVVERKGEALVVPEEGLMPVGNKQFVYKVVDGQVVNTEVQIGQRRGGKVEILEGLTVGDVIVTAGQLKIQPGMPVMVMPAGGAQGAPPAGAAPEEAAGAEATETPDAATPDAGAHAVPDAAAAPENGNAPAVRSAPLIPVLDAPAETPDAVDAAEQPDVQPEALQPEALHSEDARPETAHPDAAE